MLLLLSSSLLLTAASLVPQPTKYVKVINLLDRHLSYSSAWDLQLDLMQHHMALQDTTPQDERPLLSGLAAGDVGGVCVGSVVLCQHSPTYTLGSATTEGSGPFSKTLSDGSLLEYETFTVERAGQATYHGPGQLVVYPILDLGHFSKDINLYLRGLEEVIISTLAGFQIPAQRIEGESNTFMRPPHKHCRTRRSLRLSALLILILILSFTFALIPPPLLSNPTPIFSYHIDVRRPHGRVDRAAGRR